MVVAHHLIWTAYGWWLPNDPRGSMSRIIRNDIIGDLGELHYGRKRVQPAGQVIRDFYTDAAGKLKHELLVFDNGEHKHLAECFAESIRRQGYTCYACAIMPDHVHMLIRKHKHRAEDMIHNLQADSRLRFRELGQRTPDHPVWGGPGWKVFLDTPEDVERTIHYIEQNPLKASMPAQRWPFMKEYDGWPLHKQRARK
jgi:REP element-mobilizing transposase RayT